MSLPNGPDPRRDLMSPEQLASDADRERAYRLLKDSYVDGRLTIEEFSERADLVETARTVGSLDDLTRDLPQVAQSGPSRPAANARRVSPTTVAIMSSNEISGAVLLPEKLQAFALMGSCKMDLRRASISSAETVIEIGIVMGSLEIIVPPGIEVVIECVPIMGKASFVQSEGVTNTARRYWNTYVKGLPDPHPSEPDSRRFEGAVVRVTGLVLMGEVKVVERS